MKHTNTPRTAGPPLSMAQAAEPSSESLRHPHQRAVHAPPRLSQKKQQPCDPGVLQASVPHRTVQREGGSSARNGSNSSHQKVHAQTQSFQATIRVLRGTPENRQELLLLPAELRRLVFLLQQLILQLHFSSWTRLLQEQDGSTWMSSMRTSLQQSSLSALCGFSTP